CGRRHTGVTTISKIVDRHTAVHQEGRASDPRGFVACQENTSVHHILGRAKTPEWNAVEALVALLLTGPERPQQWRLAGSGAKGMGADAPPAILDGERASERDHSAFARGVGVLWDRAAKKGDERGDVDDRAAPSLEQLRDAILAAKVDALEVYI